MLKQRMIYLALSAAMLYGCTAQSDSFQSPELLVSTIEPTTEQLPLVLHYEQGVPEVGRAFHEQAARAAYIEMSQYAEIGEIEIYIINDLANYSEELIPILQADVPVLTSESLIQEWPSSPALVAQNVIIINNRFPLSNGGRCAIAEWIGHEMYHQVQAVLMKHPLFRAEFDYGPEWLKEGSAQLAAYWVLRRIPECDSQLNWLQEIRAVEFAGPLRQYEDIPIQDGFVQIVRPAVNYLVSLEGNNEQSLVSFYLLLGNGEAWPLAFEHAFGLTVEEFYSVFEEYRISQSADPATYPVHELVGIPGAKYLADMQPIERPVVGWGSFSSGVFGVDSPDESIFRGDIIHSHGTQFTKGLVVHAPSSVSYALEQSYSKFSAVLIVYSEGFFCGDGAIFKVYVDDELMYESPAIHPAGDFFEVEIADIRGSVLKLATETGPVGDMGCDLSIWGDPVLIP